MKEQEKDIELIEKYFNGELTQDEMTEVDRRLASDNALGKLRDETQDLIDGIQYSARNESLKTMQAIEESLPPFEAEANIVPLYKKPWVLGVAASISIVLLGTYFFLQQPASEQDLFTQHFEVYPNIIAPTVRGTESVESLKQRTYYQYDLGHYQEALELLQQLPADEDEGAAYLYSGICYLMLEDYESAIHSFEEYKQSGFDLFLPQVIWYLGLTYLKLDDLETARKVWAEIPEGNSYRDKIEKVEW